MSSDQIQSTFNADFFERSNHMRVELNIGFTHENWPAFEAFYRGKIEGGVLDWDLDLRSLEFINSLFLGLIIGFNTILKTRNGSLRLLVQPNSKIADLLYLSKLHRIINIHECPVQAKTEIDKSPA
jgi:anti-anti-sigma factor